MVGDCYGPLKGGRREFADIALPSAAGLDEDECIRSLVHSRMQYTLEPVHSLRAEFEP